MAPEISVDAEKESHADALADNGSPTSRSRAPTSPTARPAAASSASFGSSVGGSENLGQQFDEYFKDHCSQTERKNKVRYSAVGAGVGGVVGAAAAVVVAPIGVVGVAAASLAAGAGGFSFAKRKGKKDEKKGGAEEPADNSRPTLRRLRYLVRWGQLQLLELEDSRNEGRCLVLDEVVKAFSPWVQQMYLVRARVAGKKGKATAESDAATKEVYQHLAPLFFLLQRRVGVDAATQSAEYVEEALDSGVGVGPAEVNRYRVIFPTILETISALDKLPAAVHAELLSKLGQQPQQSGPDDQSKNRRRRLQRTVDAIRKVQGREDVEAAMANPRLPDQPAPATPTSAGADAPSTPVPSSSCSSPREATPFEIPPPGVEDELGVTEEDPNDEYFSVSEEEGPPSPARRRSAAAGSNSGPRQTTWTERNESFPLGDGGVIGSAGAQPHCWNRWDPATFNVRSATYLADRKKEPSGPCMFDLVSFDVTLTGEAGPVMYASTHPHFGVQALRRQGDKRFFFVQNWVVPPLQSVTVSALDPEAPWLAEDTPQSRVWRRFLAASPEERREVFKMIPAIEQGPWLVKKGAPKKPVLIGKKVKMQSYHEPDDHLEVVIDISAGKFEQRAAGLVMNAATAVQMSIGILIESRQEDELPECMLTLNTVYSMDPRLLHNVLPA